MKTNSKPCQLGWAADTTCDAWGDPSPFHGCKLDGTHSGACQCLCGDRRHMQGARHKWRAA